MNKCCPREIKNHPNKSKALVLIKENNAETGNINIDLFLRDGSTASFYHNGEYLVTVFYQKRLDGELKNYSQIWTSLAKGKVYLRDVLKDEHVTDEIIINAIDWLHFPNQDFDLIKVKSKSDQADVKMINKFLKYQFPQDFEKQFSP